MKKSRKTNNPVERRAHIGFLVKRTARDFNGSLIYRPLESTLWNLPQMDHETKKEIICDNIFKDVDNLGNSNAAIRELPQPSSISTSYISQYVDSNRADLCLSCHQTGHLNTSSQENTCTASVDCLMNLHEERLAAKTWVDQKSSTATATESNNKDSILQAERENIEPWQ
jgi:hypothetical protein